jgi:hypothetical protein
MGCIFSQTKLKRMCMCSTHEMTNQDFIVSGKFMFILAILFSASSACGHYHTGEYVATLIKYTLLMVFPVDIDFGRCWKS